MATTKKETKEPEELEKEELEEDPPVKNKKAAPTKKEDAPEWFQQLNNSIKELTNHLQPVKASQAGAVEIPIPQKPKAEKKTEEDPENPQQQQQKKQSFLEWLM
jgi:hypothetical protein